MSLLLLVLTCVRSGLKEFSDVLVEILICMHVYAFLWFSYVCVFMCVRVYVGGCVCGCL